MRKIGPVLAIGMLAVAVAAACGTDDGADGPTIRIRGQAFSESMTIAEVYGQFLKAREYDVEILPGAGFRTEAIDGLRNDEIDIIVDYIGGQLAALAADARIDAADPNAIVEVIRPVHAAEGATVLDYSPAVDGDAFVVRGDSTAQRISDVADLGYVLGAAAACFERPQCFLGYTDPEIYGITFAGTVTIEFGPLLGGMLAAGDVDAVVWNTTAPQIGLEGFRVLEDDKGLHPAQNIAPIVSAAVLEAWGPGLRDAINELSALITTEDLVAWNVGTDVEGRESKDVAHEWLAMKGLVSE